MNTKDLITLYKENKSNDWQITLGDAYINSLVASNPKLKMRYFLKFLLSCSQMGANPMKEDAYLVSYYSKDLGEHVGNTIFSYHFLMAKVLASGQLRGVEVKSEQREIFNPQTGKTKNELVSIATMKRKTGDDISTGSYTARWSEYNTGRQLWRSKPYIMLEKCAIAGVARWLFNDVIRGAHVVEEIEEHKNSTVRDIVLDTKRIVEEAKNEKSIDVEEKKEKDNVKEVAKEQKEVKFDMEPEDPF